MMPLRVMIGPPRSRRTRRRGLVVEGDPFLVLVAGDRVDPGPVVEIPGDRAPQARFERFARHPLELATNPGRIDRIPAVMTGTILDERDLPCEIAPGNEFPEHAAQRVDDVDVP